MYKIEFLPIAKNDIEDIVYYISHNLNNNTAAKRIRNLFIKSIDNIAIFPYGTPIYSIPSKLKYEYRGYKVKNFLIFYIIDKKKKVIIIARVLYDKMNMNAVLK